MIKIERALVSVSDKTGVVELARALHEQGCEVISTGGTGRTLVEAGVPVTDISEVSGNPEAFGGRMKTISFAVESAILFDRERDRREAERLGIRPIDMVVCNLYPFEAVAAEGAGVERLVENIDIGGPTMIRAAAKNFRWVAVLTSPEQYGAVIAELRETGGRLSPETRARLMREAFDRTADYDAAIATTMAARFGAEGFRAAFDEGIELRYGENWHQRAWLYRVRGAEGSLRDHELLQGEALSYNNVVDMDAALRAVGELRGIGCAVVKHTNPCGLAEAESQARAFELAWAGDPVSAFGSVVAFNRPVSRETVELLRLDADDRSARRFVDLMVAPAYEAGALEVLSRAKRLRVVALDPERIDRTRELRVMGGACLVQEPDRLLAQRSEIVTQRSPGELPRGLLDFGLAAVKHVKSNAIVVVRRTDDGALQLLGMGAGQPNRLEATRLALSRCRENLAREYDGPPQGEAEHIRNELSRAVMLSDAFFPFPDSVELAAEAGVRTIVEPGGSIRDKQVIARADELGLSLIFTGTRHFNH